ncbi:MAG: hypothetical protein IPM26_00560 [Saprospiraceae bacterium]|nr:hypothetical protein [Saprospiraceae bacterium]
MNQAEERTQFMMNNSPQAIMNNAVYTIPVVFHIIHLGEPVGVSSNISNAQILQALNDLNSDFRDNPMLGNDVEIEFCLAQRDPEGNSQFDGNNNNITGIQRVNGTGTGNYESLGMTLGVSSNEIALKALSNWPNTDYLNVWVVHNIAGSVLGFATFPVADDSVDGIVLEIGATGISGFSKVFSHEAGHFLNLYHTFQGSTSYNICPSNVDCHVHGDMVCDTRPHPYQNEPMNWFPCNESDYLNCYMSVYTNNVVENHMN